MSLNVHVCADLVQKGSTTRVADYRRCVEVRHEDWSFLNESRNQFTELLVECGYYDGFGWFCLLDVI